MLCTCWFTQSHFDKACRQHPTCGMAILLDSQLMTRGQCLTLLFIQFCWVLLRFWTSHLRMIPFFNPVLETVGPRILSWTLDTVQSIFCKIAFHITPLIIRVATRLVTTKLYVSTHDVLSAFFQITDAIFCYHAIVDLPLRPEEVTFQELIEPLLSSYPASFPWSPHCSTPSIRNWQMIM